MAWFSQPTRRYDPPMSRRYPARSSWRRPRRSRLLSWALCVLVVLVIVFWPHGRRDSHPKTEVRQNSKRPTNTPSTPPKPRLKPRQKLKPRKAAEHTYRADGLLEVNPSAQHPIPALIKRAEKEWASKLARQSTSLSQAVQEYRRRYKRSPPKGFEIWWDYVDFHGVRLPDEYDSIHARLQPFWGVHPSALRAAQATWEAHSDTFTIGKPETPDSDSDSDPTQVHLLNDTMNGSRLGHQRVQDQLALLADVAAWLPPFRATFTMHDGPAQFISWELRRAAEEAAERGEYIDPERIAASTSSRGWTAACPPDTPIHTHTPSPLPTPGLLAPPPPQSPATPKTFIHTHPPAMSPCLHPTHLTLSGFLSQFHYSHQFGPSPAHNPALVPTFSICASPLHSDILTVAPEQYVEEITDDPEWGAKVDERLLWRGSNTGVLAQSGNEWNVSHRIRLVEMGTRRGGEERVLLGGAGGINLGGASEGEEWEEGEVGEGWAGPVGHGTPVKTAALNAAFMDVAFVGQPIQCREPVCGVLKDMFEWKKFQPWKDAWVYKYIMDIDGNGWSARFKRLMTSNSLVFKATIFPEWYTERIMPWVHYIPVQLNLSDLYDILAFFRHSPHDALAAKIAAAGKGWSNSFYRQEDMTAYHFRLFLEYARVMSLDREAMSYRDGDGDDLGVDLDDFF